MAKDKSDNTPNPAPSDPPARTPRAATGRTCTVREWTEALGTRRAIAAAAGTLAGWTAETSLTEAAFRAGVEAYEKRPLGGVEKTPKAKIIIKRPGSE